MLTWAEAVKKEAKEEWCEAEGCNEEEILVKVFDVAFDWSYTLRAARITSGVRGRTWIILGKLAEG